MTKPTTESEKALLTQIAYYVDPEGYYPGDLPSRWEDKYGSFIAAIEAEAREIDVERLARALYSVSAEQGSIDLGPQDRAFGGGVPFRDVAAAIAREYEKDGSDD